MKTKLIIAAIAVLGAGTAIAAEHMGKADTDGDGFVSLNEARAAHSARMEEHFAKADSNGDGLLSKEERKAAHKAKREHMKARRDNRREKRRDPNRIVERLDANGSGGLSLDEFQGRRFVPDSDSFTAADTDRNGELDATELGKMMATRRAERGEKRQRSKN